MVFARVRRIGWLCSILLLLWTTVDLVEHFCHDCGPRTTAVQGTSLERPSSAHAQQQTPHADHSFCCSHTIDVKAPFAMIITLLPAGLAPETSAPLPFCSPADLYHPPLA